MDALWGEEWLAGYALQDSSTAKTLAFHKEVRTRCITLEGDDFNPGGLLTGLSPAFQQLLSRLAPMWLAVHIACAHPSQEWHPI